ncbi:MAG: diphosphate--fructose-6-phosphate 1-phosphotransferase [Spirochaetaceae bacterium]|nr:diphosphate--fructose-6-phosphate 1-phosphotransferase [Spirochaetaceae bacterium]MCF7947077.1 diphosphate--fructose-6-phosphate 1-phosphotransferase [Spirochaetia bacterium]MCF7950078.1 diphosphate--fructose-6-phosphate 1-phosphotransferase [Spirochaetaceae bacterium]
MNISPLQTVRYQFAPTLPAVLQNNIKNVGIKYGEQTESVENQTKMKELFPHTYGLPTVSFAAGESSHRNKPINIGVVLSGGQAPGGHNVIAGIYDALKAANSESKLYGFLNGPAGILEDRLIEITGQYVDQYRNTGGFDMIGSGRTKLESEEQFAKTTEVCKKHSISAIVVIGGDDSNTNAAVLAEYYRRQGTEISVIGVPKTIDGDLKNEQIEVSFGFDTATKTYAELIGNIERDANSAKKYWHFIKLMGRSASHICLECALQTQPNVAIISEEVEEKHTTLNEIVDDIVKKVVNRSEHGENFGVVLVPEGLIEFIPEMKTLISELNSLLAEHESYFSSLHTFEDQSEWINKNLTRDASYVFSTLPNNIQRQLLMDRDPHGNVQVSRIETEKLLIEMVEDNLNELKAEGKYKGKFSTQHHFFGYEGRAAFPSNFDANYTYSLGYNAYLLISFGLSGYISSIQNLSAPAEEWIAGGIPITMMMNLEMRHGKMKPVIKKALVQLKDKPFKTFAAKREEWGIKTSFSYPGAIQYFGPDEVCNRPTITLSLESQ